MPSNRYFKISASVQHRLFVAKYKKLHTFFSHTALFDLLDQLPLKKSKNGPLSNPRLFLKKSL